MDKIYLKDLEGSSNIYRSTPDYAKISGTPVPAPKPEPDPYGGHDYVEIAGIKWATMNVGASSITDTGLYFQWGDTQGYTAEQVGTGEGKKAFSWADYKWSDNGSSSVMTKYNSTDGKTVLAPEDDAVTDNWGGSWRMPTAEEMRAFIYAVNAVWTDDYNNTGVAGLVCTDKTDNTKAVFFPAVGVCDNGRVIDVGNYSGCWSSSLHTGNIIDAYFLYFGRPYTIPNNFCDRYIGCAVRGVAE